MRSTHELDTIPDEELLRRLVDLLRHSRSAEADLVAYIGEVDARRLYCREASPSMFAYCTERLHLSDAEAYLRIAAARASREHPVLLEMLADGRLHLTAIAKLAPHLTPANREALLQRATHQSKRQIEELVAGLTPRPDVPALMRKLPEPRHAHPPVATLELGPDDASPEAPPVSHRPDGVAPVTQLGPDRPAAAAELRPDGVAGPDLRLPAGLAVSGPEGHENGRLELRPDAVPGSATRGRSRPAAVEPLAPGRYKIQFTASAGLRDKLERLRGLMRVSVPDGDLAAIIEQAVTEKLERLEARRFARTRAPRKAVAACSTSIPGRERSGAMAGGSAAPQAGPVEKGERSASTEGRLPASRHIPAAVRRAVYERDQGRCRFVDEQGRRCTARDGLEFHHRHPFGYGGGHTVVAVSLLCRAHNLHFAEVDYGRGTIAARRRSRADTRGLFLAT